MTTLIAVLLPVLAPVAVYFALTGGKGTHTGPRGRSRRGRRAPGRHRLPEIP